MDEKNRLTLEETKMHLEQLYWDAFVPTGYNGWDELCGGLRKGELTLLASRPGVGKTSMGLNVVSHIAQRQPGTILVFSPHLPAREVVIRLLSIGTGLTAKSLLDGSLSAAELAEKHTEYFSSQKSNIKINPSTMPSIEDISRSSHRIPDLQLLVVHHIECVCKPSQMWDPALPWNENNEPKDKVLQALGAIAKELHVPVLCTMHSHRSLERRKNKRPRLEDLKKAEVSAELADQIVFLYRDRYYDPDGNDGAECIIAKSSQGSCGMVALDWDYTTGRFL